MKKKFLFVVVFLILTLLCGCQKYGEKNIINDLEKKLNKSESYHVIGVLQITNNDDTYQYDIDASFKKDNNYRVSLTNKSNNHEQIILKNSEGVYVVTPSLNKSFKFQSDWPKNNSQIYLLQSLIEDIKNDEEKVFEEIDNEYVFTTKVNYPNNPQLVKQKITLDNDLNFKKVEVLNSNNIPQMIMEFSSIDWNSDFNDDYFDLNSIIDKIDSTELENNNETNNSKEENNSNVNDKTQNDATNSNDINSNETNKPNESEENSNTTSTIDDIIFPLYIPTGTTLTAQEKVSKVDGERIILTFDGEKPFLLVEETTSIEDEFNIIPTFGEPYLLIDTVGALTDNSITWSSNGIDYYIVSDAMSQTELIEIASSISAIPTIK